MKLRVGILATLKRRNGISYLNTVSRAVCFVFGANLRLTVTDTHALELRNGMVIWMQLQSILFERTVIYC